MQGVLKRIRRIHHVVYQKRKPLQNSSSDTLLYAHSSFISCFTSAQCAKHRQHGQPQADMDFLSNASQHVADHRVDCSCHSNFYDIRIC